MSTRWRVRCSCASTSSNSPSLPEPVRAALLALSDARLDKSGVLTITARRFREQARNRADARARLAELIRLAATPKKPRRATRPSLASKKRRAEAKTAPRTDQKGPRRVPPGIECGGLTNGRWIAIAQFTAVAVAGSRCSRSKIIRNRRYS